ncbi:hypothetical protein [Synechococcus sp. BA-132 BA5]|uniref:hypothetical protein n=1 Tax=Synechococcus sp. BA-132 BA5 TaxID=3110252 RepID=UPI002B2058C0|nr:hypothetical protein [Synechococcus sp. BA-132 BA5]MEA5417261.1 hypothetical protein [Synechococcus sp. BA-132 BA5]
MNPITAQPPTITPSGSGSPSFQIRGGESSASQGSLRLDRINSAELLRHSRRVYFRFLESCPTAPEPQGVVLLGGGPQGRVVFEAPILLPDEQFVPMDLLRPRSARGRTTRGGASRPLP